MIIYNRFTEKNKVPQPLQFSELALKIKRHDSTFLVFAKVQYFMDYTRYRAFKE